MTGPVPEASVSCPVFGDGHRHETTVAYRPHRFEYEVACPCGATKTVTEAELLDAPLLPGPVFGLPRLFGGLT